MDDNNEEYGVVPRERAIRIVEETRERVTKIEARVQYIEIRQSEILALMAKQDMLLEGVTKQINAGEATVQAIRERTDKHTTYIEKLQEGLVDTGKILQGVLSNLAIIRWFGGAVGLLVIGYLFTQFIK